MIPEDLLPILRCPTTRQPLAIASPATVAEANARLSAPVTAGLVTADGALFYPIRDEIPVLLTDEAVPLR